jgi:hypothetical protein
MPVLRLGISVPPSQEGLADNPQGLIDLLLGEAQTQQLLPSLWGDLR